MGPMVQRVSYGIGYRFCPFKKLFLISGITGYITLIYAKCAHGPPFIVVPCQPDLTYIFKDTVPVNFLGRQMVVVINYGQFLRIIVI